MTYKIPEDLRLKMYNERFLKYKGRDIHVTDLKNNSIGLEDIKKLGLNRFVKGAICQKFTDNALEQVYNLLKDECDDIGKRSITYNEAIINIMLPEVIKRLRYKKGNYYKGVFYIDDINKNKKINLGVNFVQYKGKEIRVQDFKNYSLTTDEYKQMIMDSYTRDKMYEKLNNEAFIKEGKLYLRHCGGIYNSSGKNSDFLILGVFKELLTRLENN